MRSVPSDLTTRARIRDAAIELFAAHGFDRTSVKAIAEAAGVSAGLVIHHFGSKAELRRHCDEHVLATLQDERKSAPDAPVTSLIQELLAQVDQAGAKFDYLGRMLREPGETADRLYGRLIESTAEYLAAGRAAGTIAPCSDPEATALLVTVFGIAHFLDRDRITRAFGLDPLSPDGARRLTVPTLELLTGGLYADSSLLDAAREAIESTGGPTVPDDETPASELPDPETKGPA